MLFFGCCKTCLDLLVQSIPNIIKFTSTLDHLTTTTVGRASCGRIVVTTSLPKWPDIVDDSRKVFVHMHLRTCALELKSSSLNYWIDLYRHKTHNTRRGYKIHHFMGATTRRFPASSTLRAKSPPMRWTGRRENLILLPCSVTTATISSLSVDQTLTLGTKL
jgi:hypothetical protein